MEEYLIGLLMFGVSTVGSAIQGAITKHRTAIDNDTIPVRNGATWGTVGGVAAVATGDPYVAIGGLAGAIVSSVGHKLINKIFG